MRPAWISARLRDSSGFTLIEVLMALVMLVVGLLALFLLLDTSVKASLSARGREGATTLARELTEDAHSISYSQLTPGTVASALQALPGMSSISGSAWQVKRRGITYTITASECSVDDPRDGYGAHDSTFCSDSSKTGTADQQPIDLKRVTVNISWTINNLTRSTSETTTVSSAGQVVGLTATTLQLATPAVGSSGVSGSATHPNITSTGVTGLTFTVTAPTGTTAIVWTLNGVAQGWTATNSSTTWTSSSWTITGLSDGTYQVGAQAQEASGVIGPAVTIPVTLARSIPTQPQVINYGFNTNLLVAGTPTTVAELQWLPNPELNVTGYKIFDPSGTLICTTTSATSKTMCGGTRVWCMSETACVDLTPPATNSANLTYQVAATYYSGGTQTGPATNVDLTGGDVTYYALAPSTQNTSSNCSGGTLQDMLTSYTPGTDTTQSGGTVTFCSNSFASGATLGNGGTATVYLANSSASACTATGTFSVDGASSGALTASRTVPAHSASTAYTFSFSSSSSLMMSSGDRLDLSFGLGGSCTLHYGASTYPGQFTTTPLAIAPPPPPASLTVTPQADGTAVLTWPVASGGTPVSFYRIYRDGTNYGNRYDTVDAATCVGVCTYTDKQRTAAHTYSVTSVGGTTPGANMAESASIGPVTG